MLLFPYAALANEHSGTWPVRFLRIPMSPGWGPALPTSPLGSSTPLAIAGLCRGRDKIFGRCSPGGAASAQVRRLPARPARRGAHRSGEARARTCGAAGLAV